MTKPKPVRAWAVYRPDGNFIKYTLASSEDEAKAILCSYFALDPMILFIEMGYTVHRVTITPDLKGEEHE